jgi:hypothetical protein
MNNVSKVEFTANEIVIIGVKSPMIIRIVLSVLFVAFFSIPIIALILQIIDKDGLHFILVPTALFFWGFAYFFLRTILWNSYGKETITITPELIEYIADYKFFKGPIVSISMEELEFTYIEKEKHTVTFIITDKHLELIENVLPISLKDMDQFENMINDYYRKLA